ncbi:MAG: TrkA C-terminal domain-containing protein [Bacillota bacterium]|nr:TrkA C-terminal domain-containing protein [Bacillota bacterium]
MNNKSELSVYERIAHDIAGRIAKGELRENSRISGRSVLAGEYKVSPETVRRSINILSEKGIVSVSQGSGAVIISRDKALDYIRQSDMLNDFSDLRRRLKALYLERAQIDDKITGVMDELLNMTERFRYTDPVQTVEYELDFSSPIVDKTINESEFRKKTGATIVALKRKGKIILSPPADEYFLNGDVIVVACSADRLKTVENFIGQ